MKHILVPTDFSNVSLEACKFAIDLAAKTGSDVTLLHIIDLPIMVTAIDVPMYVYDPKLKDELIESAKKTFEKLKLSWRSDVNIVLNVAFDSIVDAVRDKIGKGQVDIVVMGTKGTSGFDEFLFGSNTEKVVRFSTVPVVSLKSAITISSIKKIVFPVDLDVEQPALIERVKNLQQFFGATLHLLWINTPINFVRDTDTLRKMSDLVRRYQIENYVIESRSDRQVGDGIISYCGQIKADLIAMGTHGRRGLGHIFIDSVAEGVVNHANYPIWTYSSHG